MSKSCTGFFFTKIKEKPMNIIIENGKHSKFKDRVRDLQSAQPGKKEFFMTKPQTMNDLFKAEEMLDKLPNEQREEAFDDLNSLFEESVHT